MMLYVCVGRKLGFSVPMVFRVSESCLNSAVGYVDCEDFSNIMRCWTLGSWNWL